MGEIYKKKHAPEIEMIWDEDGDTAADQSYTAAEVIRLRAENERLKTVIRALERDAARMSRVYERVVEGARKVINKWKMENAALKVEIARLEKALAEEVLARRK